MVLNAPKTCSILSFDYLDFDVYLNVCAFYRSAGFRITRDFDGFSSDLVVILRGWPPQIYDSYSGVIHVYDYVKELSIDYLTFFPLASRIFYISIAPDPVRDFSSASLNTYIHGYLPVFPEIWLSSSARKCHTMPLHIANYKSMPEDPYQVQLISLFKSNLLRIYGAKWSNVGINSRPLSYWSANQLLAKATHCYGLMYPYQRGKSLSGRMWQAPINGCVVLSELGTNIFNCPGVVETDNFLLPIYDLPSPCLVSSKSISFWMDKTILLSENLGLTLSRRIDWFFIYYLRFLLFRQHILFLWDKNILSPLVRVRLSLSSLLRRLL